MTVAREPGVPVRYIYPTEIERKACPMRDLIVGTWFDISEGCSMRSSVGGSNQAHLMLGENELELAFDAESLREFVKLSTAALAEMDAKFAREEADRESMERRELAKQ